MPTKPIVVAVIPARWASTRFPGKPLAAINNKPMIQWVVENASKANLIAEVIVATDDQRVYDSVQGFGGKAEMTSADHISGSDRIAEVAAKIECDIVVNVQGDEPMISPENLDRVIQPLLDDSSIFVSTLMMRIKDQEEVFNPNVVKVVTDKAGKALYFSRSPIPFDRENWSGPFSEGVPVIKGDNIGAQYKHFGIYAYTKSFLMEFTSMKPSKLEKIEKLEQLRILENGFPIKVVETDSDSIGVDTAEDLEKIAPLMRQNQ